MRLSGVPDWQPPESMLPGASNRLWTASLFPTGRYCIRHTPDTLMHREGRACRSNSHRVRLDDGPSQDTSTTVSIHCKYYRKRKRTNTNRQRRHAVRSAFLRARVTQNTPLRHRVPALLQNILGNFHARGLQGINHLAYGQVALHGQKHGRGGPVHAELVC